MLAHRPGCDRMGHFRVQEVFVASRLSHSHVITQMYPRDCFAEKNNTNIGVPITPMTDD